MTDRFRVQDVSGEELDAECSTSRTESELSVVLEQADTARARPRNPQYKEALLLILQRLAAAGATLVDARVVPPERFAHVYPDAVCRIPLARPYPLDLVGLRDPEALFHELTGPGMRAAAGGDGSRRGGGAWRRLRLVLAVPGLDDAWNLRRLLRGDGPSALDFRRWVQAGVDLALPDRILPELDRADASAERPYRLEQRYLRDALFATGDVQPCGLCGRVLWRRFLVAAHIKPRRECTLEERLDLPGVVMPACLFGCDILFEHGYLYVNTTGVLYTRGLAYVGPDLPEVYQAVQPRLDRPAPAFNAHTAPYFRWHELHRLPPGLPEPTAS